MRGSKTEVHAGPQELQKGLVRNSSRDKKTGKPSTIFKPLWNESKVAIKQSVRFKDFDNFHHYLVENLPQNSEYIRKRYATVIIRRFFPERSLETIPALVWKHYKNERYLQEVMRFQFLQSEPIIGEFVITNVLPHPAGSLFDAISTRHFTEAKYAGRQNLKDNARNITTAMRDLGFIYRSNTQATIRQIKAPKTSLLVLTHYLFAKTPRTVTLKEILSHDYWRFLGIDLRQTVRSIFSEADERDLIAKYSTVDELEQITTKYSLQEFLEKKLQL
jgi:hypothetical protein